MFGKRKDVSAPARPVNVADDFRRSYASYTKDTERIAAVFGLLCNEYPDLDQRNAQMAALVEIKDDLARMTTDNGYAVIDSWLLNTMRVTVTNDRLIRIKDVATCLNVRDVRVISLVFAFLTHADLTPVYAYFTAEVVARNWLGRELTLEELIYFRDRALGQINSTTFEPILDLQGKILSLQSS